MICVLISFIFEFKAVSPGRTQCFALAAKIYGDCASWLGVFGWWLFQHRKCSLNQQRCLSKYLHHWSFTHALWSTQPQCPGLCLPCLLSSGRACRWHPGERSWRRIALGPSPSTVIQGFRESQGTFSSLRPGLIKCQDSSNVICLVSGYAGDLRATDSPQVGYLGNWTDSSST